MIKDDEIQLMRLALRRGGGANCLISEIKGKRENFILYKWTNRGCWQFGVTMRSGWLTSKGYREFREATTEKTA